MITPRGDRANNASCHVSCNWVTREIRKSYLAKTDPNEKTERRWGGNEKVKEKKDKKQDMRRGTGRWEKIRLWRRGKDLKGVLGVGVQAEDGLIYISPCNRWNLTELLILRRLSDMHIKKPSENDMCMKDRPRAGKMRRTWVMETLKKTTRSKPRLESLY